MFTAEQQAYSNHDHEYTLPDMLPVPNEEAYHPSAKGTRSDVGASFHLLLDFFCQISKLFR
jgi:hypothetical protein